MNELDKEKVFGIGLTRTGTKSLKESMKILGYKTKHSPISIDEVRDYDFICDIIISSKYEFLDYVYPKAKFILTTRETEAWIRSNIQHASRYNSRQKFKYVHRIPLHRAENRFNVFGVSHFDEKIYRRVQKEFENGAVEYFTNKYKDTSNKLLIFDICKGESWDKLCAFLGKEIITEEFPKKNWSTYTDEEEEISPKKDEIKPAIKQAYDMETGIWSLDTAKRRHRYDEKLAEYLGTMCGSLSSIADIGCGRGDYCKYLKDMGIPTVHGYEGTIGIKEISAYGDIMTVDLTKERWVGIDYDLVLCLEVGEHIPHQHEQCFIDNLCRYANKDLILSWAVPGQGGAGHINELSNEYIIGELAKRGFEFNKDVSDKLREASSRKWFKNTLMKFEKVSQEKEES